MTATPTAEEVADGRPRWTSYSLLTEPWLLVRDLGGRVREVSLDDAFTQAHRLRGLVAEIPTQEAAALRLMLAILYRALPLDEDDDPVEVWGRWWRDRRLPTESVLAYLGGWADRFDMLHPQVPFFQVAGLHTSSGRTSGLGKLIAEVPDGEPYFTTRAGREVERLTYAEAARWLVHCQAYDHSGIKSGAVGDDRVKGGKGYPIGVGWAGNLGLLVAEGSTLAETLLLNLVLDVQAAGADRVPWEQPPTTAAVDRSHTQPQGPADLSTWQVRRIRLIHDGQHVTDAIICNGDPITAQNRHMLEPMSSWRFSEPQTKKLKAIAYMPLAHPPERALWRGLSSVLGERMLPGTSSQGNSSYLKALSLEWLARLRERNILASGERITLRAAGMQYGTQNSSVVGLTSDRMALAVGILTDPELRRCAIDAADSAEYAVRALGRLASNLADAAGRRLLAHQVDGAGGRATTEAFGALDSAYRAWIERLVSEDQINEMTGLWHKATHDLVLRAGQDLILRAGQPAQTGRVIGTSLLNAPKAEILFRSALKKALPRAYPEPSHTPGQEDT